ncbi:MAG: hypothetical protein RLZZ205_1278, partial [Bacteroidota bacterium]
MLHLIKVMVQALFGNELLMVATFHYFSIIQYQDVVTML